MIFVNLWSSLTSGLVFLGPSIKYVTLLLANFNPLPLSHFVTHPGTSPKKYVTHLGPSPRFFSWSSTKNPDKSPLYELSLNCSRGFCQRVFLSGRFCSGCFLSVPLSVRIHLLQQKVKHHLRFHVSYV